MSDLRPEWPRKTPDAATLIRYLVGSGQFSLGLSWAYIGSVPGDHLSTSRYLAAVERMQHSYDLIVAIKAVAVFDPAAADRLAERIWQAADAGDSYGEEFWVWAKEADLDPDAIYEAGLAAGQGAQP